jgi:aryl sulfotransferase
MKGLVLLTSYPKSGNTWFRAVLTSVWSNGQEVDINKLRVMNCADRSHFDRILGISSSDLTNLEISTLRPRVHETALRACSGDIFYKVHDAWLPTFPERKYEYPFPRPLIKRVVYIVRDPRDVAVSLANHMGQSINAIISLMNSPAFNFAAGMRTVRTQMPQLMSRWTDHFESWVDRGEFDVHLVKYEDMLANPHEEFRKAFDYLGISVTDRVLSSAIGATRFEKLKNQEVEGGFFERPPRSKVFFRKGVAGGWSECLTGEQANQIVTDHGRLMRRLGYLADHTDVEKSTMEEGLSDLLGREYQPSPRPS